MEKSQQNIVYLHNSSIDVIRWDKLVHNSPNGRSYACSWYLDILNSDWHGLIFGDYQYVMPVISSSKFGIRYAFQPVYAQQHGIFPPASPEITRQFIDELKKQFWFIEISFNAFNLLAPQSIGFAERKNYILSLYNNYPEILNGYSQHARRYVSKARKQVEVLPGMNPGLFLDLKARFGGPSIKKCLPLLKQITAHAISHHEGWIYGAYDQQNQACAAAFFLKEKGRYTYLSSVSTPEGKTLRAMYLLIDRFIADHAGQPLLLDFEGSEIEGIARFFSGFGAVPEYYPKVKYNRLPKIIRWLKP